MIKQYGYVLSLFFALLLLSSCALDDNPEEDLVQYCIRECVIETGDAEICDANCNCAAEKLSTKYSNEAYTNLIKNITQEKDENSIVELKNSFNECKDQVE